MKKIEVQVVQKRFYNQNKPYVQNNVYAYLHQPLHGSFVITSYSIHYTKLYDLTLPENSKVVILAPLVNRKKGTFADLLESLRGKGYVRAMIDGVMVRLDEDIELAKTQMHTIKVVIDRVVIKDENKDRIAQDVEKGLKESFGELEIEVMRNNFV